jgi:hypothetical protein
MFEHAAEWRPFLKAMTEAGKIQDVMEIGRECFARGIARRIEEMGGKEPVKDTGRKVEVRVSGAGPREPGGMPRSVATPVSQMLAGSLMGLLAWWLHAGQGLTATDLAEPPARDWIPTRRVRRNQRDVPVVASGTCNGNNGKGDIRLPVPAHARRKDRLFVVTFDVQIARLKDI